jgi:hypothetical protein
VIVPHGDPFKDRREIISSEKEDYWAWTYEIWPLIFHGQPARVERAMVKRGQTPGVGDAVAKF